MTFVRHEPAFKGLIKDLFHLKQDAYFLDLTLGDGSHTEEALDAGASVVSLDVDIDSIERSVKFLEGKYTPVILRPGQIIDQPLNFRWLIVHSNFSEIGNLAKTYRLPKFNGILADLGTSQNQLAKAERGFSFREEAPLDMRLDQSLAVSAKDLVNALGEKELIELFSLADEYKARAIAKAIVRERKSLTITTTTQLADLISQVKGGQTGKIHPATKVFMALRMAVNLERDSLGQMLQSLPDITTKDGLIGIISFHSGEDRLVKSFMKEQIKQGAFRAITVKPLIPNEKELQINPKIRSAKLRLIQKN